MSIWELRICLRAHSISPFLNILYYLLKLILSFQFTSILPIAAKPINTLSFIWVEYWNERNNLVRFGAKLGEHKMGIGDGGGNNSCCCCCCGSVSFKKQLQMYNSSSRGSIWLFIIGTFSRRFKQLIVPMRNVRRELQVSLLRRIVHAEGDDVCCWGASI